LSAAASAAQNVRETRILLTVNPLPVGVESFLANCQTPLNHELLIPTRPMYSRTECGAYQRFRNSAGTDSKHRSWTTKCREIIGRSGFTFNNWWMLNNPLADFTEDIFAKIFHRSRWCFLYISVSLFLANVKIKFYKIQIIILRLSYFARGEN